MGDLGSIDDAFDAALNLEESHIDEGWEDGLRYACHTSRPPARTRRAPPPPPPHDPDFPNDR